MGFANDIEGLLYSAGVDIPPRKFVELTIACSFVFGLAVMILFLSESAFVSGATLLIAYLAGIFLIYVVLLLTASRRIALAESMLPDFLSLMASNIRSGYNVEGALINSARREFGPLTTEVNKAVKLSMAGKPFEEAFETVGENIDSDTIKKSVRLILEGSRTGGNLAELLDNTATDVRRFNAIKNEVNANVMQHRLFMFAAAGLGAPFLFGTANFIIEIVFRMKSIVAPQLASATQLGIPFLASTSTLSPELTLYFSIAALVLTSLFTSLAGGVISTGKATDDLKYFPVILVLSLAIFMTTKIILENVFSSLFVV